jgi:hypothetical protein
MSAIKPASGLRPRSQSLLKIDAAAYLRRTTVDNLFKLSEGGTLIDHGLEWVFNVATNANGVERDLRFWSQEIEAPETTDKSSLAGMLAVLLPRKLNFASQEVTSLLQIRRSHLMQLRRVRALPPGKFTSRAALENFLQSRWLGAESRGQH